MSIYVVSFFHELHWNVYSRRPLLHSCNHKWSIYEVSFLHELHQYEFSSNSLLHSCNHKWSIYEVFFLHELKQYGFSNLTEIFLTVDANNDNIITNRNTRIHEMRHLLFPPKVSAFLPSQTRSRYRDFISYCLLLIYFEVA